MIPETGSNNLRCKASSFCYVKISSHIYICRGADKSLAFHSSPTFIPIMLLSHQSLFFFYISDPNFIILA
jgi:hypothetical protein